MGWHISKCDGNTQVIGAGQNIYDGKKRNRTFVLKGPHGLEAIGEASPDEGQGSIERDIMAWAPVAYGFTSIEWLSKAELAKLEHQA